jgi:hypothetical protein
MTMARLHTRKKFVKKPKETSPVKQFTNIATDYIKQWTQKELSRLQENRDTSICIPTKDGYKIGLYNLRVYPNKTCDVYDHNTELVHTFESKISAVLYTIYTIKRQYKAADEIFNLDTQINKNYTDMISLRRGVESARKQQDYVALDVRQIKLDIAESELTQAREKMAKLHRYAKFAKVWE